RRASQDGRGRSSDQNVTNVHCVTPTLGYACEPHLNRVAGRALQSSGDRWGAPSSPPMLSIPNGRENLGRVHRAVLVGAACEYVIVGEALAVQRQLALMPIKLPPFPE